MSPAETDTLRTLAVRLAAEAAALHRAGRGRVLHVETKGSPTDHVSEVDRDAERVIVEGLQKVRGGVTVNPKPFVVPTI